MAMAERNTEYAAMKMAANVAFSSNVNGISCQWRENKLLFSNVGGWRK